jgi:hypothetical protein
LHGVLNGIHDSMKCALVVCILVLALGSHASKHGKSSSSSSEDKDSCVPAQCIGEGELGSSCGPVSDGCGMLLIILHKTIKEVTTINNIKT